MTLRMENLEKLSRRFSAELDMDLGEPNKVYYVLSIDLSDVKETIKELNKYAPFGEGNPPIVFRIKGYECSKDTKLQMP